MWTIDTFAEYMSELGLNVGRDHLVDKKREREVKSSLKEYLKRQKDIDRLCDLTEEIDLQGLEEYLEDRFLEDAKKYLFGRNDDRAGIKRTIIAKARAYAKAGGRSSLDRVEKWINDILDIFYGYYRSHIDDERLFLENDAIDSIMRGTQAQHKDIIETVKGIADDAKKEIIDSIGKDGKSVTKDIHENELFKKDHAFVMENYIKKRYQERHLTEKMFDLYSELFKLSIDIIHNEETLKIQKNIFDLVREDIITQSSQNLIKVIGPDGVGKSTFLSILYIYLYQYCQENGFSFYPFYMELHFYDQVGIEAPDAEEEVRKRMGEDLSTLKRITETYPDLPLIIMIDGNESYFRTKLKADQLFNDYIEKMPGHKKIVCIGEKTNVNTYRERKNDPFFKYAKMLYTFRFRSINRFEEEKIKRFVKLFEEIEGNDRLAEAIDTYLKRSDLDEVDLNTLSILKACYDSDVLNVRDTLSDLYKNYCMAEFKDIDLFINSTKIAYEYYMTNKKFKQEEIVKHIREWGLLHQHKSISNFLIAYYFVSRVKIYDENVPIEDLEYLFPKDLNLFIKPLINDGPETQRLIFDQCKKIYARGGIPARSQALYMVGRIASKDLKVDIASFLEKCYEELYVQLTECTSEQTEREEQDIHLLLRSAIISLVYLGKKDKREAYLKMLLDHPTVDRINRGFHLEYYGDAPRKLGNRIGYCDDDGTGKIDITYHILLNHVKRYLSSDKGTEDRNFQINLFTLCSLVQARLEREDLPEEYVQNVKEVIDRTMQKERSEIDKDFKAYLTMLKEDIETSGYAPYHLYEKLYRLKEIERKGWKQEIKNDRGGRPFENVAEHIYFTWILGMLYLPDVAPKEKEYDLYDKGKILDAILIHDWAEVDVGDEVPEEDTSERREKEDLRMRVLLMHDTYEKIGDMSRYKKMWNVYGKDRSDINGKLAYELDKIQALYQFYVYKREGARFTDEKIKDWKSEKNKITTLLGQRILKEVVQDRFGD